MQQQIDIVIAWVDGNDLELKKKRHKYLTGEDASDAVSDTRFASNNEIYYNIASILKYVPFCRNIFVVTDNQRPEFIDEFTAQGLCTADKIRVVDHREIFRGYEQHLPTFNTRSIESMLWNIEGLSDYFIYLNDDFFFNSTAQPEAAGIPAQRNSVASRQAAVGGPRIGPAGRFDRCCCCRRRQSPCCRLRYNTYQFRRRRAR